jgi:hypothetical protein
MKPMAVTDGRLLRRGLALEYVTLGWNVVGFGVLALAALAARSVALAGFGLDSLVEIGASLVVVWERTRARLPGTRAMRLAPDRCGLLRPRLSTSPSKAPMSWRPAHSLLGIARTAVTCAAMPALASGKAIIDPGARECRARHQGRVTLIDVLLAGALLVGRGLSAALGWRRDAWGGLSAACASTQY